MDYYRSLNGATLDPDVPTVFELFAAKQLTDLINPYIRYILVHYAQAHPQYLLRIVKHYDELFLAVFGAVEYAHLRQFNASFVEKFYGLQRVNRLPVLLSRTSVHAGDEVSRLRRLTRRQILLGVVASVGVPYLKEKAQVRYERLVSRYTFRDIEEDRPPDSAPLTAHLRFQADVALLAWFPRLTFAENAIQLLLCMQYLFRGTGPFSIADWLLNTRYSRLAPQPPRRQSVLSHALGALGYVLPTTLFAIKFLEWWNTSQFSSKASIGPDLPPPDTSEESISQSAAQAPSPGAGIPGAPAPGAPARGAPAPGTPAPAGCPICGKPELDTPSVLETGVAYCYKCIWDHLQSLPPATTPKCPATGIELLLTEWNRELNQWDIGGIRRLMI